MNTRKRRGLSINITLILINVALFVIFTILISANFISIDDVAIKPSNIFQGKYLWTFFTSMFMHAGFFHIFANMLSLVFIGSLVERILGKKRYLLFYLASGLFAGIFFVLASFIMANFFNLPGDFSTYAVGASGAIFGLIGFLVLITPNLPVYMFFIPIPIKMKYAAPAMLAALWLISIFGNLPVGNTAHLGGLLFGIFYGIYIRSRYRNKTKYLKKIFS